MFFFIFVTIIIFVGFSTLSLRLPHCTSTTPEGWLVENASWVCNEFHEFQDCALLYLYFILNWPWKLVPPYLSFRKSCFRIYVRLRFPRQLLYSHGLKKYTRSSFRVIFFYTNLAPTVANTFWKKIIKFSVGVRKLNAYMCFVDSVLFIRISNTYKFKKWKSLGWRKLYKFICLYTTVVLKYEDIIRISWPNILWMRSCQRQTECYDEVHTQIGCVVCLMYISDFVTRHL